MPADQGRAGEDGSVTYGTSSYTHVVCGRCATVLYCSEAEPWHPQTDYGWCWHGDEPDDVWTQPPTPDHWHRCDD